MGGGYPFVGRVRSKLTRTIRNNPNTIRAVPSHEPPPPLLAPHFRQRRPNTAITRRPRPLNLEQNLHPLEGRHNRPRHRARDSPRDKRRQRRGPVEVVSEP